MAAATGGRWGDPQIVDETLDRSISTGSALEMWSGSASTPEMRVAVMKSGAKRGAGVVFGGIHATLFPDKAVTHGAAHAVVRGDGDVIWPQVIDDCFAGRPRGLYEGGRIGGDQFVAARWELLPRGRYMWASVQTVRG